MFEAIELGHGAEGAVVQIDDKLVQKTWRQNWYGFYEEIIPRLQRVKNAVLRLPDDVRSRLHVPEFVGWEFLDTPAPSGGKTLVTFHEYVKGEPLTTADLDVRDEWDRLVSEMGANGLSLYDADYDNVRYCPDHKIFYLVDIEVSRY